MQNEQSVQMSSNESQENFHYTGLAHSVDTSNSPEEVKESKNHYFHLCHLMDEINVPAKKDNVAGIKINNQFIKKGAWCLGVATEEVTQLDEKFVYLNLHIDPKNYFPKNVKPTRQIFELPTKYVVDTCNEQTIENQKKSENFSIKDKATKEKGWYLAVNQEGKGLEVMLLDFKRYSLTIASFTYDNFLDHCKQSNYDIEAFANWLQEKCDFKQEHITRLKKTYNQYVGNPLFDITDGRRFLKEAGRKVNLVLQNNEIYTTSVASQLAQKIPSQELTIVVPGAIYTWCQFTHDGIKILEYSFSNEVLANLHTEAIVTVTYAMQKKAREEELALLATVADAEELREILFIYAEKYLSCHLNLDTEQKELEDRTLYLKINNDNVNKGAVICYRFKNKNNIIKQGELTELEKSNDDFHIVSAAMQNSTELSKLSYKNRRALACDTKFINEITERNPQNILLDLISLSKELRTTYRRSEENGEKSNIVQDVQDISTILKASLGVHSLIDIETLIHLKQAINEANKFILEYLGNKITDENNIEYNDFNCQESYYNGLAMLLKDFKRKVFTINGVSHDVFSKTITHEKKLQTTDSELLTALYFDNNQHDELRIFLTWLCSLGFHEQHLKKINRSYLQSAADLLKEMLTSAVGDFFDQHHKLTKNNFSISNENKANLYLDENTPLIAAHSCNFSLANNLLFNGLDEVAIPGQTMALVEFTDHGSKLIKYSVSNGLLYLLHFSSEISLYQPGLKSIVTAKKTELEAIINSKNSDEWKNNLFLFIKKDLRRLVAYFQLRIDLNNSLVLSTEQIAGLFQVLFEKMSKTNNTAEQWGILNAIFNIIEAIEVALTATVIDLEEAHAIAKELFKLKNFMVPYYKGSFEATQKSAMPIKNDAFIQKTNGEFTNQLLHSGENVDFLKMTKLSKKSNKFKQPIKNILLFQQVILLEQYHKSRNDILDENGNTKLHQIFQEQNIDEKKFILLLYNGTNLNIRNKEGKIPLIIAIKNQKMSFLQSQKDRCFKNGKTLLHFACDNPYIDESDLSIITTLLKVGFDPNKKDGYQKTSLSYIFQHLSYEKHSKNYEAMMQLIGSKADLNCIIDKHQRVRLHYLCLTHQENTKNYFNEISYLLEKGANINSLDDQKKTPLHFAVNATNIELVKLLVKSGADLTLQDHLGKTPLHYAIEAENPNIDIIKTLLEKMKHINIADTGKNTALHHACKKGLDLVDVLLKHGANPNLQNSDGMTPFHLACIIYDSSEKSKEKLRYFLIKTADISIPDNSGNTSLHYFCRNKDLDPTMLNSLLLSCSEEHRKKIVNTKDSFGYTPLYYACNNKYSDAEVIKILLEGDADPKLEYKVEENSSVTAVQLVFLNPKIDFIAIAYLIKYGAVLNFEKMEAKDHLSFACATANSSEDDQNKIALLLLNTKDYSYTIEKSTALHFACKNRNIALDSILILLPHFQLDTNNNEGYTPFHYVVENRSIKDIQELMNYQASINQQAIKKDLESNENKKLVTIQELILSKTDDEKSVLHLACTDEKLEINKIEFFLNYKIDVNGQDSTGKTPLHYLCLSKKPNIAVINFLLAKGANPTIKDNEQKAPWFYACENKSHELIKIFNDNFYYEAYKYDKYMLYEESLSYKECNTLLHVACEDENPNFEIIKYLLGEDKYVENAPNRYNNRGKTPFQLICSNKNVDIKFIALFLIHHGEITQPLLDIVNGSPFTAVKVEEASNKAQLLYYVQQIKGKKGDCSELLNLFFQEPNDGKEIIQKLKEKNAVTYTITQRVLQYSFSFWSPPKTEIIEKKNNPLKSNGNEPSLVLSEKGDDRPEQMNLWIELIEKYKENEQLQQIFAPAIEDAQQQNNTFNQIITQHKLKDADLIQVYLEQYVTNSENELHQAFYLAVKYAQELDQKSMNLLKN